MYIRTLFNQPVIQTKSIHPSIYKYDINATFIPLFMYQQRQQQSLRRKLKAAASVTI